MTKKDKQLITVLYQIYGELNRIRLIMGEDSKRAKKIEKFDKEYNYYAPYFGSEKGRKKYEDKNPDYYKEE